MLTAVRVLLFRPPVLAPALALAAFLPTRQPIVSWPSEDPLDSIWEEPVDLPSANLFDGPWGSDRAPDPDAPFTLLRATAGRNRAGVLVTDPYGREWDVRASMRDAGADAPAEVVVSRVLSAVGYHQPPVYFLPSFTVDDGQSSGASARTHPGGRFRLHTPPLKDMGSWSWRRNPFVGTQPHQGLLAILLLFDSTDLKDSNNALYRLSLEGEVEHWYVVRDLGTALGHRGRSGSRDDDAARYEQSRFIAGLKNGFVEFANRSAHPELFQQCIRPDDVRWAGGRLAQLSDRQWHDAFRAGGYVADVADRFIRKIRLNIEDAQHVGAAEGP